ncbi:MAG: ABC transporter permease, partial [Bacteroidota bacterium]
MLALKIARRYFFSKHKKQFINLISIISLLVVLVGTAALVITLSVFNGLEGVIKGLHSTFNPDLQIQAKVGKSFPIEPGFLEKIQATAGVDIVSEVIEDNALLRYRDGQMVVVIKGVSDNFLEQSNMGRTLVYGEFKLKEGQLPLAVLGHIIQGQLGINLSNRLDAIQIWYPRRRKKKNLCSTKPEKNYNRKIILPKNGRDTNEHQTR